MSADGSYAFAGAPSPEELAVFPLNDLGNAQRLIRLVGGTFDDGGEVDHTSATLLYLRNRGWIAFNGRFWDLEAGAALARRRAHQVARQLIDQGKFVMERGVTPKAWRDFVEKSGSSGSSGAMLTQAESYLTVGLDAFDQQPMTLNVRNGTLKFRRDAKGKAQVKFSPAHDPADRLTRLADVDYDPKAKAPLFEGFLDFCQPKAEMRAYLRALFGYCATGSVKEQLFVILQGKGGDGKSTFVNAIKETMGAYAATAAIETFLDSGPKKGGDASPDIARLAGDTRMICSAEPPRGAKLASGAIKSFTGGGTVTARELRMGIFEFHPIGKVVIECNGRPQINDTDDGIWRRIRVILFERQVKREDMDLDLPDKLKAERAGILNWIVGGITAWLEGGLVTPEAVANAVDDYRRGSNPFSEWLADRVSLDPEALILSSDLYNDYKSWCEDNGVDRPMSQTAFGRALGDLQVLGCGKDGRGRKQRKGARLRLVEGRPSIVDDPFEKPGAIGAGRPGGPRSAADSAPGAEDPRFDPDAPEWEGE